MFAETLREYQDRRAMLQALASDPDGIAYVALGNATPELRAKLKVIPVGATDAGPFVPLTRATVTDHSYPLARYAYLYFAPDGPGGVAKPIDPKLREFLTYVPVSYTHLDVYKRQSDACPCCFALPIGTARALRRLCLLYTSRCV